jgi:hypothetical protein
MADGIILQLRETWIMCVQHSTSCPWWHRQRAPGSLTYLGLQVWDTVAVDEGTKTWERDQQYNEAEQIAKNIKAWLLLLPALLCQSSLLVVHVVTVVVSATTVTLLPDVMIVAMIAVLFTRCSGYTERLRRHFNHDVSRSTIVLY